MLAELQNKLNIVNERELETRIYIPNEIFSDLQGILDKPSKIGFAHSYYYLINYLYRFVKYDFGNRFDSFEILETLGHSPTARAMTSDIIKKGGVLDQLGYTETTTNFPVEYKFDEFGMVDFVLVKDYKKTIEAHDARFLNIERTRNSKVKVPVKAFYRDDEAKTDDHYNGTFYSTENTHGIPIKRFFEVIGSESGTIGFYIYAWIKFMCDKHSGLDMTYDQLSDALKIPKRTLTKYIGLLESNGFIDIERSKTGIHQKPNVYRVKE